ncbi:hypothetical protein LAZ67_10002223 [Cordylochernes scorpioides]|uniref:Integrase catalytic domain-containing protein n=1 Tax=Cordylochernes scorpioides TaxID=51811 RepID=A0ABY6KX89_9ARAC|nr:hypothetical protein LAZ67_10002223 [Cordylochernes scorpioides]
MDAVETKSRKDLIEASNTHFKETVKRDESGRYIVSLPWIAGHPPVPVNRRTTENRLLTTTRNVQGKMLYEKYDTIFEEWEKEKIIEEVEDKWEECNYLPHRPVLKDSHTTPIRPVFDASCKKKGLPSLNQCLEKGDNLIELIPDLLLRFRLGKYGIIADIRKAFLQIQALRVVFGLTSSPFLLAATIKYHLSLPQFKDNMCAELLARSFYVDNCILSLSSTHDVKKFIKESSDIMMQAKFELRDWMWNEPGITEQDPASILGMKWHLQTDTIAINVQSLKNIDEEKSITKRSILSACHRIFDPIQFTCPATIKIKKMVQDAWKENKSWDEPLNEDRRVEFIKWRKQALELDQIKIPRWILPIKGRTTLHVFCDASAIAYAMVIFMRIENASVIVVRFVEARNRLATIKRITIPRLELLACLIGARLLVHVLESLEESPEKIQCWTDSSPALYWIQQQENWAQFVSNRVKEITTLTKSEDWNHVAGEHNTADLPSRAQYDLEAIEEERRKTVVTGFVAKKPEENPWYLNLYEGKREVTLPQILRVIAWMLRFKPSEYKGDMISQEELDSAEKSLVKIIQSESIGEEDTKMKQLHAFQDKEGLWRVKTRIVNRNDDELFRLPILIPTNHPVTELIVKSVHEKMYHCGAQTLRSVPREKFWIPKARQLVLHVIHKCPRCRRFETKRLDVPEASLPQHRVRDVVVFEVTGIDLGGPLYLEDGQKVWFVIFTCGVYRAVHLELVTSLSTEALVGAVERFIARRGCPAVIYSDNGTNLVGLRNELYRVNFGVKWKLNPPAAPWWGGWIERIVGLTKKLLRRLLGKRVVNYEEMVTILGNCERVINTRPLTYIAEDNDDLVPLTPEMFLREPRTEGEIDLNESRCNFGKSYEKRKRLLKEFRKRFRSEYLGLLVHHDNRKKQRQLKVGDIVLVEVENRKQINWPMGKITRVFPGTDNVRRLVEVKTKFGFMKRAVQRLFPLEVPSEDVEQGDGELKPAEDEIVREKTPGVESVSVQEKTIPVKVIHHRSGDLTTRKGCLSPSQTILVLVGPGHPPQVRWLDYRKGISVSGSVLPRLKVALGFISTPRNHQRLRGNKKLARVPRTGYLTVILKENFILPFSGQNTKPIFLCLYAGEFGLVVRYRWPFQPSGVDPALDLSAIGSMILGHRRPPWLLNYEELLTLLAQIEVCLNSRPLTFVSNDPNDLTALTPGHFLIGNAIQHDAESDHSTLNLRFRWNLIQPQRDYFWNCWSYLVMLKEQDKPLQWKLARIVQIFPGEDDHTRVVLLRTPKGLLKRPITKICPIPYKDQLESSKVVVLNRGPRIVSLRLELTERSQDITDSPVTKSRQDSGRQGTSKQIDHCLYRKMEQGREENPKEPMESDPDSESGGSTTFPKKENTLGRTQEIVPGQEDVTPPPLVSDVLGRLTKTLHQLSAVTGHRERWNRYDGSYKAQSFFTNYDAQADRAQLQYSTRLKKPPDLLQAPLRVTNTRTYVTCSPDHLYTTSPAQTMNS